MPCCIPASLPHGRPDQVSSTSSRSFRTSRRTYSTAASYALARSCPLAARLAEARSSTADGPSLRTTIRAMSSRSRSVWPRQARTYSMTSSSSVTCPPDTPSSPRARRRTGHGDATPGAESGTRARTGMAGSSRAVGRLHVAHAGRRVTLLAAPGARVGAGAPGEAHQVAARAPEERRQPAPGAAAVLGADLEVAVDVEVAGGRLAVPVADDRLDQVPRRVPAVEDRGQVGPPVRALHRYPQLLHDPPNVELPLGIGHVTQRHLSRPGRRGPHQPTTSATRPTASRTAGAISSAHRPTTTSAGVPSSTRKSRNPPARCSSTAEVSSSTHCPTE